MKSIMFWVAVAGWLLTTSCDPTSKEDPQLPAVDSLITMTFTGIAGNGSISGTVTGEITAKSERGIKKIDFFINDSLYATVDTSVYKFNVNTLLIKDGPCILRAVAYDTKNHSKEFKHSVTVKNPLLNLMLGSPSVLGGFKETLFIITDSAGAVLSKVKFGGETGEFPVGSEKPSLAKRINIYQVIKYENNTIIAYLNIKRGSTWSIKFPPQNIKAAKIRTMKVKNIPAYDVLTYGGDNGGTTYYPFQDPALLNAGFKFNFSIGGKALVQYEKSGKAFYNFYDVPDSSEFTVDASKATKASKTHQLSYNGAAFLAATVYGRPYKDFANWYNLGVKYAQGSQLTFFIPDEPMDNYLSMVSATKTNGWIYDLSSKGLVTEMPPFTPEVSLIKTKLNDFKASFTGEFNYYETWFINKEKNINVMVFVNSGLDHFIFPDLGTIANIPGYVASEFVMENFALRSSDDFKENALPYNTYHQFTSTGVTNKAIRKNF